MSCASCHKPELAFADGLPHAIGAKGRVGNRNTPSLLNVRFVHSMFWDGRRESLEAQAVDPLVNPNEHALTEAILLKKVRADQSYAQQFLRLFSLSSASRIKTEHIADALANFQRRLLVGGAAFDRYQYQGKMDALSPSARRGLELFRGRAQCASCHQLDDKSALFTDGSFHSLGVGQERLGSRLGELAQKAFALRKDRAALDAEIFNNAQFSELGRFLVTSEPQDIGAFRTPSLRNVALTAPYMHDGSVATLNEAIDLELYYRGARNEGPLILSTMEKADLLEFLSSLTSPQAKNFKKIACRIGFRKQRD